MLQKMTEIKIKPLTKEQILISTDRLTRFKETETKYLRVFSDIITSNLLEPRYKKSEILEMDYSKIRDLTERIINFSLEQAGISLTDDYVINQRLYDYENAVFYNSDEVKKLLKNKINYKAITALIEPASPKNLLWLKELATAVDIKQERREKGLLYPVEKLVLVEGITEETLLPEFAGICGMDFDQNGIYTISAGGKNQVVKYFYRLSQTCKLPVFVLLDSDAQQNLEEIKPKLRETDRVHILRCGEFEDILPDSLIKRTLDYATRNISLAPASEIEINGSRVEFLEAYFRHRGLHEFKKADFAAMVKENLKGQEDISAEIQEIFNELFSPMQEKSVF